MPDPRRPLLSSRLHWTVHLAPWVFPIDYDGRKSWTWWNPRFLLVLLLGPCLLIGALNPLASLSWRYRALGGLAGVAVTALLALCVTGYRRLAAFVDEEERRAAAAAAPGSPDEAARA
ncbi:hypothetical protein ACQEVS_26095 [Streptomyces sp. CA-181903]|uniref:hypothetical protein n=1 Tax=Streptomyces sp. CA-181903 TaxID=3240055 RepID=UPI003D94C3B5